MQALECQGCGMRPMFAEINPISLFRGRWLCEFCIGDVARGRYIGPPLFEVETTPMVTLKATVNIEFKDGRTRRRTFWTFRLTRPKFHEVVMKRCHSPLVKSIVITSSEAFNVPKEVCSDAPLTTATT